MAVPLLIDGKDVYLSKDLEFKVFHPEDRHLLHTVQGTTIEAVNSAVEVANKAFSSWSQFVAAEKRQLLWKAATLLGERAREFEQAVQEECNFPPEWTNIQVPEAKNLLEELGALVTQPDGFLSHSRDPSMLPIVRYEPLGVCVGIAAWNAPLMLGFRAVAYPLAAGNTVVMKSSEQCPKTHYLIAKLFLDAGFPKGTVNLIHNTRETAPEVVNALVSNFSVRKVNFTGSVQVGRIIAKLAGEHLKSVLLELGGKSPFIVLDDADLNAAAEAAVSGSFLNNGQICMSTDRIVVLKSIAAKFKKTLIEYLGQYSVKGSMISPEARNKVQALIDDATGKGANAIYENKDGAIREGSTMNPCILTDITPEMKIYEQEIFGSCATLHIVNDEKEAIEFANNTVYGLSSSIYTKDVPKALAMAKQITTGAVHINGSTVHDEHTLPHGGTKDSGFGRFGSSWGLREFQHLKTITIHGVEI